jgi:hypothetical protein
MNHKAGMMEQWNGGRMEEPEVRDQNLRALEPQMVAPGFWLLDPRFWILETGKKRTASHRTIRSAIRPAQGAPL